MKIDRYQGWINGAGYGAVNDHQDNKWVIEFKEIDENKREKLLKVCLEVLNEEMNDGECMNDYIYR